MEIRTLEELRALEIRVLESARNTAQQLVKRVEGGIQLLRALKFERAGFHPLDGTPLNLIEQLNQTFTYLVSFEGARMLFDWHRDDCSGFRLNLGTASGSDIESIEPGVVAAEVFAAVAPDNNDKLTKDIRKVQERERAFSMCFSTLPECPPDVSSTVNPQGVPFRFGQWRLPTSSDSKWTAH